VKASIILDGAMPIKAELEFVEEIKRRYVGKWIGAKGKEVVAVFDSHEELIKEIRKKGLDNVYVFYSPSPKEKEYEFLFLV